MTLKRERVRPQVRLRVWERVPEYLDGKKVEWPRTDYSVVYLYRTITCSRPATIEATLSTDAAGMVWLNGKEVERTGKKQKKVKLDLQAGENRLFLKVAADKYTFGFSAELNREISAFQTNLYREIQDSIEHTFSAADQGFLTLLHPRQQEDNSLRVERLDDTDIVLRVTGKDREDLIVILPEAGKYSNPELGIKFKGRATVIRNNNPQVKTIIK